MLAQELLKGAQLKSDEPPVAMSDGPSGQVWKLGPYVVKTMSGSTSDIFRAEARGLDALSQAGCRTPKVYGVGSRGLITQFMHPGHQWTDLASNSPTFIGVIKLIMRMSDQRFSALLNCQLHRETLIGTDFGESIVYNRF